MAVHRFVDITKHSQELGGAQLTNVMLAGMMTEGGTLGGDKGGNLEQKTIEGYLTTLNAVQCIDGALDVVFGAYQKSGAAECSFTKGTLSFTQFTQLRKFSPKDGGCQAVGVGRYTRPHPQYGNAVFITQHINLEPFTRTRSIRVAYTHETCNLNWNLNGSVGH